MGGSDPQVRSVVALNTGIPPRSEAVAAVLDGEAYAQG